MDAKDLERFILECLTYGLLHLYGIERPPVPVATIAENPIPGLGSFSLRCAKQMELDALYRPVFDGPDLLIVNQEIDSPRQRFALARVVFIFITSLSNNRLGI